MIQTYYLQIVSCGVNNRVDATFFFFKKRNIHTYTVHTIITRTRRRRSDLRRPHVLYYVTMLCIMFLYVYVIVIYNIKYLIVTLGRFPKFHPH